MVRNVRVVLARMGIDLAVGFVLTALLARVLGPDEYGAYALALLLPLTLSQILDGGISAAQVYFLGQEPRSRMVTRRASDILTLATILAGLVIGAITVIEVAPMLFQETPPSYLWLGLGLFPLMHGLKLLTSELAGLELFMRGAALQAARTMGVFGLVIVLVVMFPGGAMGALKSQLIATMLVCLLAYSFRPRVDNDPEKTVRSSSPSVSVRARQMVHYGARAHLSNVLMFLNYRADLYLLSAISGVEAVGIYFIAVRVSELVWSVSQAVASVLLPRLARGHASGVAHTDVLVVVCRLVLAVSAVLGVFGALLFSLAVRTLFGPDYEQAVWAVYLLLPGIVAGALTRVLASDLAARGKPELNAWTSGIALVVNVTLNLLAIPKYGILGASAASGIAYFGTALSTLFFFTRLSGKSVASCVVVRRSDVSTMVRAFRG